MRAAQRETNAGKQPHGAPRPVRAELDHRKKRRDEREADRRLTITPERQPDNDR
jgi:hypothetical protein